MLTDRIFTDYRAYLASDHWRQLRLDVLRRWGFRCAVCNSDQAVEVHHRTYVRVGAERETDLLPLCRSCHQLFHDHGRLWYG